MCNGDSSDGALRRALAGFDQEVGADGVTRALDQLERVGPRALRGMELGEYRLGAELGHGGMGVVYEATQQSVPGRVVAIKLLRGFVGSATALRRFAREVEALGRLDHPNIVPIFAASVHEETPYFVMKRIVGETLRDRLARGDLDGRPREVVTMVRDLARALHHAHERGVVHRDVKPGNIMVEAGGRALLTDFGLASLIEDDSDLTMTVDAIGTPDYMAPEQISARLGPVSRRTDVYGLGVVLYECLAGVAPFAAEMRHETMAKVMNGDAVRLRSRVSSLERGLDNICHRAMQRAPSGRYATAAEFADDLDRLLLGQRVHARAGRRLPALVTPGGRRLALVALIVVALAATTLLYVAVLRPHNQADARLVVATSVLAERRHLEQDIAAELARLRGSHRPGGLKKQLLAAARLDAQLERSFEICLADSPWHAPTRAAYADFLALQLRVALEGGGVARRAERIAELDRMLAEHDDAGGYVDLLDGRAELHIDCARGAADVWLCPVNEAQDGRAVVAATDADGALHLGATPLDVEPPEGNWQLRARLDGYSDIELPLLLRRRAVQRTAERRVDLEFLTAQEIGSGYRQVHGGFSVTAEHRLLPEERGDRLTWVDGFLMTEWELCQGDLDGLDADQMIGLLERTRLVDLRLDSIMLAVSRGDRRERERGARFSVDLPTPTEWLRAARGADGRPYAWGHGFDEAFVGDQYSWRRGEGAERCIDRSPFGIYDLTGSVPEVCRDPSVARSGRAPRLLVYGGEMVALGGEHALLTNSKVFSDSSPWAIAPGLRFVRRAIPPVPAGPRALRIGDAASPFVADDWQLVALHGPFRSPVRRDTAVDIVDGALSLVGFADDFSPVLLAWRPIDVAARGVHLEVAFTVTRDLDVNRALSFHLGTQPGYPEWDDRVSCQVGANELTLRFGEAAAVTVPCRATIGRGVELSFEVIGGQLSASIGDDVATLPIPDGLPERFRYVGVELANYVGMKARVSRIVVEER